jgi:hypothetical protein
MQLETPDKNPTPEEAGGGDPHRVLLLADEQFRGRDLADELRSHLSRDTDIEIFVISPAISHSRLDYEMGNIDPAMPEAGERMVSVIQELNQAGFRAEGKIGDADPLVAIGDGLAEFKADEIVVVTHGDSEADPAEKGIWQRLETDFHQPVTQLKVVGRETDEVPGVVEVKHAPAHRKTQEEEIQETRNFPPLLRRDIIGILVGFIGTVALGMIAVAIGNEDNGDLSGSAAVVLLIAIGAFLINVAHIVGLLFFESVRYTGIWERFMSRMSIFVTGGGLAVALILWLT